MSYDDLRHLDWRDVLGDATPGFEREPCLKGFRHLVYERLLDGEKRTGNDIYECEDEVFLDEALEEVADLLAYCVLLGAKRKDPEIAAKIGSPCALAARLIALEKADL